MEIARSLVAHTSPTPDVQLEVTIASRNPAKARWVATVAAAHAEALGRRVRTKVATHDWNSIKATTALIEDNAPDLIFHAASLQSAWSLSENNRWSRFVLQCGYGVTTPLQLLLARHVQDAIAASRPQPRWINACYPDLVNAALALTGAPPLCGIGNVAILAEHIRLELGLERTAQVRLIASHADVPTFQRARRIDDLLPAAWCGQESIAAERLAAVSPLPSDASLNAFNAAEAARLIWAALNGQAIQSHAPGPCGLEGGYPITLDEHGAALDLPVGLTREDAVAMNRKAMARDGATIDFEKGWVVFGSPGHDALVAEAPGLADGFRVTDARDAAREMRSVRQAWLSRA
jgi:hypothetical protein